MVRIIVCIALLVSIVGCRTASMDGVSPHEETPGAHAGEEAEARNAAAVFLGGSWVFDGGESGFSLGLGYERRIDELIGLGGFVEYSWGDLREWIFGAGMSIHLTEEFALKILPGIDVDTIEDDSLFLLRLGCAYEIPIEGGFFVEPEVLVDFVEGGEQVLVAGLSFGTKF